MHTWFHYICEDNLERRVQNGFLMPHGRFIHYGDGPDTLPDQARQAAIWGFHCPEPDICPTDTPEHHPWVNAIKKQAAHGQTLYLLKITSSKKDALYVADTGVFPQEDRAKPFPKDIEWDSKQGCQLREDFKKHCDPYYVRYWESLIPFASYKPGRYTEPEVVCFSPVALQNIKLIKTIEDFKSPASKIAFEDLLFS